MFRNLILSVFLFLLLGPATGAATPQGAPPNDDFDSATVIPTTPYTTTADNSEATIAADDPAFPCNLTLLPTGSATLWWKYTAPAGGRLRADTFGTEGFDTILGAWTGARGSLVNLACNDDANDNLQSAVEFNVTQGMTYYVEVADIALAPGAPAKTRPRAEPLPSRPAVGILQLNVQFVTIFLPLILSVD